MKGYKAFEKGMICRGKQYAENTVFEEESAEICKSRMHFCENPFDVLDYYPLVDGNGELIEVAEVEALDEAKTDDGKKFCTKKLKIGAKLSFGGFINAGIDFLYEKTIKKMPKDKSSGNVAQIGSSGNGAQIGSSGNWAQIGSSGDLAQIGSSGDLAQIGSSGNWAKIGSSGDWAKIGSSGDLAQIGSSGNGAQIGSSGNWAQIGSSGDLAQIGSSGNEAKIGSSGNEAQIGSSGDLAQIGSSGNGAKIKSTGKHSVIMAAGNGSCAKGKIGSWITLAEWGSVNGEYIPLAVVTKKIDGVEIKEDTFYTLENGEFKEVEE